MGRTSLLNVGVAASAAPPVRQATRITWIYTHPKPPWATHIIVLKQVERDGSIPWYIWLSVAGVTSATIGVHWDISWHRFDRPRYFLDAGAHCDPALRRDRGNYLRLSHSLDDVHAFALRLHP